MSFKKANSTRNVTIKKKITKKQKMQDGQTGLPQKKPKANQQTNKQKQTPQKQKKIQQTKQEKTNKIPNHLNPKENF